MRDGTPVLDGIRVLDLTSGVCGPYATKLLADAGADVVKLEPPGGDPLRAWSAAGTPLAPGEDGALFRFLNTSKRSAVVDVTEAAGRTALLELAAGADLVFEDLGPGRLEALGVGHEALAARNPRLSLVSISPFGRGGPWSERPANDFTLQAWAGSTFQRGLPGEEPVSVAGRLGEFVAAAFAAPAALLALGGAERGGRGRHVDVSIYEAMLLSFQTFRFIFAAFEPGLELHPEVEIPSVEPARDGYVGFCTITAQQWMDFCLLIERPDLRDDEELRNFQQRMLRRDEIWRAIHAWTRSHSIAEILERAELLRVPSAPVLDGSQLPEADHLKARGVYVENPAGFLQPRVPLLLERCAPRPFAAAPRLGEHTQQLLGEARQALAGPATRASEVAAAPLAGMRVLDLTTFWAGPVATCAMAAFGADVIKVEAAQRPDMMRFASGFERDVLWEWSPIFHGANAGKRGITLNLADPRGRELLLRLVDHADLLVENFSPRVLEGLDLGWEPLRQRNPRLVLVRMPAFGLDGPWRDRTGFAMTIEQVSGLAWRTGHADGRPLVPRGPCDPLGGMHALFAALLALRHRERTGEGQLVEIPLVEAGLNAAAEQVIEWSAYGARLSREGNRSRAAAPQGVYRSRDPEAWVAISVESDAQWAGLRRALDEPAWAAGTELADRAGRHAHHDQIDAGLLAWCAEREQTACVERLLAEGVPAAPVLTPMKSGESPQSRARGFFQQLEHPLTGPTPYPSFPARFAGEHPPYPRPSPTLGQHGEDVLRELLGLSDAELAALHEAQVIGTQPVFG